MGIARVIAANGPPKKFKVAVALVFHIGWEEAVIRLGMQTGSGYDFTLLNVKFKSDGPGGLAELGEGLRNGLLLPCQAAIVQVRIHQLKSTRSAARMQSLKNGLDGQRKKQWPQRIALLNCPF